MKVDSFQVVTNIKKATSLFHGRNIMDCNTRLELTAKKECKILFLAYFITITTNFLICTSSIFKKYAIQLK